MKSRASELDRPSSCTFSLGKKGAMHAGTYGMLSCVMSSVSDATDELQWHVVRCEIGASVLETQCPGNTDPNGTEQHQIPVQIYCLKSR